MLKKLNEKEKFRSSVAGSIQGAPSSKGTLARSALGTSGRGAGLRGGADPKPKHLRVRLGVLIRRIDADKRWNSGPRDVLDGWSRCTFCSRKREMVLEKQSECVDGGKKRERGNEGDKQWM